MLELVAPLFTLAGLLLAGGVVLLATVVLFAIVITGSIPDDEYYGTHKPEAAHEQPAAPSPIPPRAMGLLVPHDRDYFT